MDSKLLRQMGHTLVEALFATLLLALLVSVAGPPLARLEARSTLRVEVQRLWESVLRARETAVALGRPVILCPVVRDAAPPRCADVPAWHGGWIAFQDADGDGHPDHGLPLVDRAEPSDGQIRITTSSGRRRFRFDPRGMAFGTNATIRACHADRTVGGRVLVLSNTGRIRVDHDGDPGC